MNRFDKEVDIYFAAKTTKELDDEECIYGLWPLIMKTMARISKIDSSVSCRQLVTQSMADLAQDRLNYYMDLKYVLANRKGI